MQLATSYARAGGVTLYPTFEWQKRSRLAVGRGAREGEGRWSKTKDFKRTGYRVPAVHYRFLSVGHRMTGLRRLAPAERQTASAVASLARSCTALGAGCPSKGPVMISRIPDVSHLLPAPCHWAPAEHACIPLDATKRRLCVTSEFRH